MKRIFFLMLCMFSFSVCAHDDANCVMYKIEEGVPTPFYGSSETDSVTRQLGSVLINPSGAGITISFSGNYILANNLIASAATGAIRIESNNVNLNLNGYFVSNDAGAGIDVVGGSGIENVVVRNGTVRACDGNGLQVNGITNIVVDSVLATDQSSLGSGFDFGSSCTNVLVINCRAQGNGKNGFNLQDGQIYEFRQCTANLNTQHGFDFLNGTDFVLESCFASSNTLSGINVGAVDTITIRDTQTYNNMSNGIAFLANAWNNANVEHCESSGNVSNGFSFSGISGSEQTLLLKDCTAFSNTLNGFALDDVDAIQLSQLASQNNGNSGYFIDVFESCSIDKSFASFNSDRGMFFRTTDSTRRGMSVRGCTCIRNTGNQIEASVSNALTDTLIFDCDAQALTGSTCYLSTGSGETRVAKCVAGRIGTGDGFSGITNTTPANFNGSSPNGWQCMETPQI